MTTLQILLLSICLTVAHSYAQKDGTDEKQTSIDDLYIDFAPSDLSASKLLGVKSDKVTKPGNVKELAASMSNFTDRSGNIKPGLAVEWAPFMTKAKKNITAYRKNRLRNLQVSYATLQDSAATNLGFGAKWVLVDKTDPLMNKQLDYTVISYLETLDDSPNAAQKRQKISQKFNDWVTPLQPDPTQRLIFLDYLEKEIKTTPAKPIKEADKLKEFKDALKKSGIDQPTLDSKSEELENMVKRYVRDRNKAVFGAAKLKREFTIRVKTFMRGIQSHSDKRQALVALLNPDIKKHKPPYPFTPEKALSRVLKLLEQQEITLTKSQEQDLKDLAAGYILLAPQNAEPALVKQLINATKEDFKKKNWNAMVAELAIGTTWASPTSTFGDLGLGKFNAFAGLAHPVKQHGQIILNAQYSKSYKDNAKEKAETSLGGRLLLGNSDDRWSIEGMWSTVDSDDPMTDGVTYKIATGYEFKLADGLWLEIAVGGDLPQADGAQSQMLTLSNIRYSFQKERRFKQIP